jgi:ABC-type iron transport system FetAB ATPase subunit
MLQDKIDTYFKSPIFFSKKYKTLPDNIIDDLEILKNKDPSKNTTVYDNFITNNLTLKQLTTSYSSDASFILQTQNIISNIPNDIFASSDINKNAWNSFKDIKEDTNFLDKYQYINWEQINFLNSSVLFLTINSLYSIISPALNIISPIILFLIPFLLLKLRKIPITIEKYVEYLSYSMKNHSFGKIFTHWNTMSWGQKSYMLVIMGLYFYNIYQNILSCISFYKNTFTINKNINNIKQFLLDVTNKINTFKNLTYKYSTYIPFNKYLDEKLINIQKLYKLLNAIPTASFNPAKIAYIGYTLKQYYLIYSSSLIEDTLLFSFGFNSYLENMQNISSLYKSKKIHKATVVSSNKPMLKYKNIFNPITSSNNIIKNSINIKNNKIITGPNASGKTTLIKTLMVNTIITQQFGFGFYDKATVSPFDFFHCYINIPDTSSRDSLFQAEARQCLDIINKISNNPHNKHLCIFDELFSGTNPYEAISSGKSYLEYISNFKTVRLLLTTHFVELCEKLNKNTRITNINMETKTIDNNLVYTYKIKKGISSIKGGINVLKNLNFPNTIITETIKNLKTI